MCKHQIPKRIRNNANHISSSIMVLQTTPFAIQYEKRNCHLTPKRLSLTRKYIQLTQALIGCSLWFVPEDVRSLTRRDCH